MDPLHNVFVIPLVPRLCSCYPLAFLCMDCELQNPSLKDNLARMKEAEKKLAEEAKSRVKSMQV